MIVVAVRLWGAGDGEEPVDGGPHGGDVVVGAAPGGEFGRGRVGGEADLEQLAGLVRVHGGDPYVTVGVDGDEALAAEAADGLGQARDAHVEGLGEVVPREP
ncbi:hypothetical protein [Streptomyces sp. NPDC003247]|uniref:hypothetical protein n=1 Tax=Streptomyces sp. NPDC003247 TaxID=3364677 RepID=UPI0036BC2203